MANPRALSKVAKEVREIATFALGQPTSVYAAMEVKAHNFKHSGPQELESEYRLWILGDEVQSWEGTWEQMLGLVEWLKDVEVPVVKRFRKK
jgi:hypothetical protein